jgi:hypothetical protein
MIYQIVILQFSKTLTNLLAILDKAAAHAEAKKFDMEILLHARLAPDQFNLIRQAQIACDTAKLGAARLAGKEDGAPSHPDTEQTLDEVKARIQGTIDYLGTFTEADFTDAAKRRVTQPRWKGKTLSGEEFLLQHAVPNLFFHATTLYAILRHNGVDVGKKDYLGELSFKG